MTADRRHSRANLHRQCTNACVFLLQRCRYITRRGRVCREWPSEQPAATSSSRSVVSSSAHRTVTLAAVHMPHLLLWRYWQRRAPSLPVLTSDKYAAWAVLITQSLQPHESVGCRHCMSAGGRAVTWLQLLHHGLACQQSVQSLSKRHFHLCGMHTKLPIHTTLPSKGTWQRSMPVVAGAQSFRTMSRLPAQYVAGLADEVSVCDRVSQRRQ